MRSLRSHIEKPRGAQGCVALPERWGIRKALLTSCPTRAAWLLVGDFEEGVGMAGAIEGAPAGEVFAAEFLFCEFGDGTTFGRCM